MNKNQKEIRLKQKREFARQRKLEKRHDVREDMEEDDELLAVSDEQLVVSKGASSAVSTPPLSASDQVEKDYAEEFMFTGPTSFEELDALDAAREQANAVSAVSWKVQDLVYNIIRSPMMDPKAKGKAIKSVGEGFETRVSAILSGKKIEKDLDILSIEAILAHDARRSGVVEKAKDWLNGKNPKAVLRKTLAQMVQQIEAGGAEAEKARAELPRVRTEAKALGIETRIEQERAGLVIEKDAQGEWRWVGWSTNKFMDWDGEILTEAAHKEYTEWLDEHPDMAPVFLSWHTPETMRKNVVDFWTYENGFLIMSGVLLEAEAAELLQVQKDIDLGMSHGTLVLERDPANKKVITKYRMFEVSELPLENAANPFTSFETVIKEADMDKRKYFASLFGEEKAERYLALTKETEGKLEEAGVASKELAVSNEPLAEGGASSTPPLSAKDGTRQSGLTAKDLEEVVKAVGEKFDMDGLNAYLAKATEALEKVPMLEELIKNLAESQDEQLAEKISPQAGFVWSVQKARASQADVSKLRDGDEADETLKKSAPRLDPVNDWLAMQTGAQPIRMNQ